MAQCGGDDARLVKKTKKGSQAALRDILLDLRKMARILSIWNP